MVVPCAAGGPTDTIARILADRMGPAIGQTIIVENIGGAGASVGVGVGRVALRRSLRCRRQHKEQFSHSDPTALCRKANGGESSHNVVEPDVTMTM